MSADQLTRQPVRQRGDVIRQLRLTSGRRVPDLARSCGLSAGTLRNYESERAQAGWPAIHALARALAAPVTTLLRNPDEPVPALGAPGTAEDAA